MDDAKEKIREFIWTNHLQGKFSMTLTDTTRLRTSGLLDSLAAVGLVTFIEKEFDVEFSALDLTVDNFDTIKQMASLISRKKR
jgi:acyl carrier protein